MRKLSLDEINYMSLEDKISRMDEILGEIHLYRFHSSAAHFPYFKVENLINTKAFQSHNNQTKLAWMCFEFLLQGEYMMTYFGMMNRLVYDDNHHAHGWGLLRSHINYNALTQAVITGSRIQFEQLMNFIYYSFECKELGVDNKGSKISKFRNWLMMKGIMDDLFSFAHDQGPDDGGDWQNKKYIQLKTFQKLNPKAAANKSDHQQNNGNDGGYNGFAKRRQNSANLFTASSDIFDRYHGAFFLNSSREDNGERNPKQHRDDTRHHDFSHRKMKGL